MRKMAFAALLLLCGSSLTLAATKVKAWFVSEDVPETGVLVYENATSHAVSPDDHVKDSARVMRWHDEERRATCWIIYSVQGSGVGISCVSDSELRFTRPLASLE